MFDIAFSEMLLIAVIALIVIGPERLPMVARMLGRLTGRLQRYVANAKADIDRELYTNELREIEHETRNTILSVKSNIHDEISKTESSISQHFDQNPPDKSAK